MQVMITVYDYDAIDSNDFLGYIEVCVDELFKSPGTWINKIYLLKDEHGNESKNGDIYLQFQWVPKDNSNIATGRPQLLSYDKNGEIA